MAKKLMKYNKKKWEKTIYLLMFSLGLLTFPLRQNYLTAQSNTITSEEARQNQLLLNLALGSLHQKQYKLAIKKFQEYLDKGGDQEIAWSNMALAYLELNDFENAEKYLLQAHKLKPQELEYIKRLFDLLTDKQEYDRAFEYLQLAQKISPQDEDVLLNLTKVYYSQGDKNKTQETLRKIFALYDKALISIEAYKEALHIQGEFFLNEKQYDKALANYQQFISLEPNNLRALFVVGELHKINGKFSQATQYFLEVIEKESSHESSLLSLSECYFILNNPLSVVYAKRYLANSANPSDLLKGIIHLHQHEYEPAEKMFQSILKENSQQLSAHIGISRILRLQQDFAKLKSAAFSVIVLAQAISAYDIARLFFQDVLNALKHEEDQLPLRQLHDESYFSTQIAGNSQLINKIENHLLEKVEFYATAGYNSEQLRLVSAAIADFRHCLMIADQLKRFWQRKKTDKNSDDFDSNIGIGKFFQNLEKQAEKKNKKRLDQLNDKSYRVQLSLAWLIGLEQGRELELAQNLLQQAKQLYPHYPHADFYLGLIYLSRGKNQQALQPLAIALQIGQSYYERSGIPANYYYYYGEALEKTEQFEKAEASLKRAIELDPHNSAYLNFLGYNYVLRNSNLDEAQKLIQAALDIKPDSAAYLDSMGWLFFLKNDMKQALDFLLRALSIAEAQKMNDPILYWHIAQVYDKIDRKSDALKFYQKTLQFQNQASEKIDVFSIEKRVKELSQ